MSTSGRGEPRTVLLERATAYLTERGLSDISLRELAAALGTSHRMLIYHFGSKEKLFVEVVRETERRQRQVFQNMLETAHGTPTEVARQFWQRLSSPELAPLERIFFEIYTQALQGRSYALPVLDGVVESWIQAAVPALKEQGLSDVEARAEARLGIAVTRGLLLDLLATGDHEGVNQAHERYLTARPHPSDLRLGAHAG
jgi:AcrR family transcriptional regulator